MHINVLDPTDSTNLELKRTPPGIPAGQLWQWSLQEVFRCLRILGRIACHAALVPRDVGVTASTG
jgi:hypothetical protein